MKRERQIHVHVRLGAIQFFNGSWEEAMSGIREFFAGLLILIGLGLIMVVLWLALNRNVFEGMILSLPATIVFRSGIGLYRMSMAARIASQFRKNNG